MRHTLGASLNIRHNLSSSKGPKPLQLKLLTTYIPKTSAFTLAFSTSQRLRTTRASARTFFTFRHYITPSARNFLRTFSSASVRTSVFPARTRKVNANNSAALFFFSSRRRHTSWTGDWSSDVCSSDLVVGVLVVRVVVVAADGHDLAVAREAVAAVASAGEVVEAGDLRFGRGVAEALGPDRSEERRVGKEWRGWWASVGRRDARGRSAA